MATLIAVGDLDARRDLDIAFYGWRSQVCLCGDLRPRHGDRNIGGTLLIGHGPCEECPCQGYHIQTLGGQGTDAVPEGLVGEERSEIIGGMTG